MDRERGRERSERELARARAIIRNLPAPVTESFPAWAAEVTVIITTFERPACIAQLLVSMRRHVPFLMAHVADSSREPLFPDGTWIDAGLVWLAPAKLNSAPVGAVRNHLVDQAPTELVFLCDDDQVFTSHTDVARMSHVLHDHRVDIVAGAQGPRGYGCALITENGRVATIEFNRFREVIDHAAVLCDRVENTFLARADSLRRVKWNPTLRGTEHDEFFVRARREGLSIVQLGGTHVGHLRDCEAPTGAWAWLGAKVFPIHRDRGYRRASVGAEGPRRGRSPAVLAADAAALADLGLDEIRRVRHRGSAHALRRRLLSASPSP